jgi:hypothetical protein
MLIEVVFMPAVAKQGVPFAHYRSLEINRVVIRAESNSRAKHDRIMKDIAGNFIILTALQLILKNSVCQAGGRRFCYFFIKIRCGAVCLTETNKPNYAHTCAAGNKAKTCGGHIFKPSHALMKSPEVVFAPGAEKYILFFINDAIYIEQLIYSIKKFITTEF